MATLARRRLLTISVVFATLVILLGPVRADTAKVGTPGFSQLDDLNRVFAATTTQMQQATATADLLVTQVGDPERQLDQAESYVANIERRLASANSLLRLRRRQIDLADGIQDGQASVQGPTEPAVAMTSGAASLDVQLSAMGEASRSNQQMAAEIRMWLAELAAMRSRLEAYAISLRSVGFQIAARRHALENTISVIRRLSDRLASNRAAATVVMARLAQSDRSASPLPSESASEENAAEGELDHIRKLQAQVGRMELQQIGVAQTASRMWSVWGQVVRREARLRNTIATTRQREIDELNRDKAIAEAMAAARTAGLLNWQAIEGVLLICPVDPPRAYSDDFGAPRWGGGFHLHQGNDVFAALGTPIRAPFPGLAIDASNDLGGLAVKVFGANGYVYNAHLSAFGALGNVKTGTIIGYVGNTGDAQGGATHDHFEWHPANGPAVDPFPYLNAVC